MRTARRMNRYTRLLRESSRTSPDPGGGAVALLILAAAGVVPETANVEPGDTVLDAFPATSYDPDNYRVINDDDDFPLVVLLYADVDGGGQDLTGLNIRDDQTNLSVTAGDGTITIASDEITAAAGEDLVLSVPNGTYRVYIGGVYDSDVSPGSAPPATVPAEFGNALFSVATGSAEYEIDLTISGLPDDGGDAITDVQYDIDGSGTWISVPGYAGTGTYALTLPFGGRSYAVRCRAVNGEGPGDPSPSGESAVSGIGTPAITRLGDPGPLVDANNFTTSPQTLSFAAGTLTSLEGDVYVAITMNDGTGPITGSCSIGGNAATACGTPFGGTSGTGGSATVDTSVSWFRASAPFSTDDVIVTPDGANNSGDIGIAAIEALYYEFQTGLGGGVVRDGAGSTTQNITTTCESGDVLLVACSHEGNTALSFSAGATAESGYPAAVDTRGFLVGRNASAGANQGVTLTVPSGGDVAAQAVVLRPLA